MMMLKKDDIALILLGCIIIYLVCDKCYSVNNKLEHMTDLNVEAISNLASMYASGKLIVDNIEVQKNVIIKGNTTINGECTVTGKSNLNGDVHTSNVHTGEIIMGETKLSSGTRTSLKVQTKHGWGEFGPQNAEWLHITTDRDKIYTNKTTHIDGQISTYAKDGIDDTRRLKALSRLGGFAIDGTRSTFMLEEGSHQLYGKGKYDAWANDSWDMIYVFKGWEFIGYDGNYAGAQYQSENKTEYIKKYECPGNKISTYKLTWVGY